MTTPPHSVVITKAEVFVFRAPILKPVRTSFGIMHNRPAVLLRLEDSDGAFGWGEAWCNFPSCGAEHRANLLESVLVPMLLGKNIVSPPQTFAELTSKTTVLALQTDEPGPLAQSIAAADIALWDLFARKAGKPLYRYLGGTSVAGVPAYASGMNPTGLLDTIEDSRNNGFRAFKFKIGFNKEQDLQNVKDACGGLHAGEVLAVDANQAWNLAEAKQMAELMGDAALAWLEEPLRCDSPLAQWQELQRHCRIPLAAGENIRSEKGFEEVCASRFMTVIQPDICKWGGLSRCSQVAKTVLAAGLRYFPHYLGGGIGLVASAHLLAAVGGDGMLEVDINPNPLREMLALPYPAVSEGIFPVPQSVGLGVQPATDDLKPLLTFYRELRS